MVYSVIILFIIGYLLIAIEHSIKINKAAVAILTGAFCWVLIVFQTHPEHTITDKIYESLGQISGILFFLFGAMTIVELIDLHNGFDIIIRLIKARNKIRLLWIISLITFFLSPFLDNLTTTIVMISILQKLKVEKHDRLFFASAIIIAANAGGAWSPIGDVTTTMLWIGGQLSTGHIIAKLFIPSLIAMVIPLIIISLLIKDGTNYPEREIGEDNNAAEKKLIFFSGIFLLLAVPAMKAFLHLPPFMCMLISLGLLWILSEIIHKNKSEEHRTHLSVAKAIQRIDFPSIIFFLGILLAVSALEYIGILHDLASFLVGKGMGHNSIGVVMGFLSAIIDNVPLVAGAMGMFPLDHFPVDHGFWTMLAYASGTGGSMLIIGSAAGVVAMGMEKISFGWFLKKISWIALLGFICGAVWLLIV